LPAFQSNDVTPEKVFSRDFIEAQQQRLSNVSRFPFMSFIPELETAFEEFRYQRLIKRVPAIGVVGLVLFCMFSILDLFFLPLDVSQISIPLRLFLICPLICLIMYLASKRVSGHIFLSVYVGVYLISGCAIVAIIYVADLHGHLLAYDGILLHLVFGYFLMSLPYVMAIYGGLFVSFVYLATASQMNLQVEQLASNSIFIVGLNFMGAIACYIEERARRFLFLNETLVALAKAKDQKEIESKTRLVATASHDLRQPLHAMQLLIEALDDQLPEGEQKGMVRSLDISIKQLSQLLNTLLDISKLNAGIVKPKIETLDLARKVADFCQAQSLRFKDSGISMTYTGDDHVFVRADGLLLDRIIRNVVENIFIHARAKAVNIVWKCEEDKVRLEITDNGKGIPEEDLQTIFEAFQQSGEYTSIGMGLGLTIVKQLAELQEIEFGLRSRVEQGSCFWFDIPVSHKHSIPENQILARVVIVQNTSLKFATNWSQYIQSWGYGLSVLPIASLTDLAQIKQALMEGARILILDAQGQDNVSAEIEQLNKLQEMLSQPFSVLFVMDTDTQVLESVKIKRFEVVNASVRPAKLRLILEHLNVQY
tara:strand:+ start:2483 stop:4267 length:1785 start_codon:yes stop_codon:yes gene_type:complete